MPAPEVWIADDSRSIRRLLIHHLENLGAAVRDFATGQDLLAALASEKVHPALIFLDMEMPGLTGCQTACALRRRGYSGAVVLLTSTVTDALETQAHRSGCDCVLSKSTKIEELARIVRRAHGDLPSDTDAQAA